MYPSAFSRLPAFVSRRLLGLMVLLLLAACSANAPTTTPPATVALPTATPASRPLASPTQPLPVTPGPRPTQRPTATATLSWLPLIFAPPVQGAPQRQYPPPATPRGKMPLPMPGPAERELTDGNMLTFLLLGADRAEKWFRTDAILLVVLRPAEHSVSVISFPRDLYVYIPGWTMNRINTAYYRGQSSGYPGGGPGLMADTFMYNFGIRLDYVALADFQAFVRLVDALGGLEVLVACPYTDWRLKDPDLDPQDPDNWELYTVEPGRVWMDGEMALWYARARKKSTDFDRGRRQQEILRALQAKALSPSVLPKLPALYRIWQEEVESNIDWEVVARLLPWARGIQPAQVRFYRIGPRYIRFWRTPGGASVLLPRRGAIADLLAEALGPAPPTRVQRQGLTVEVRDASARDAWGELAALRLSMAGYSVSRVTVLEEPIPHTLVIDTRPSPDRASGLALTQALGLPADAYRAAPDPGVEAAFVVLVGQDYDPCFNPYALLSEDGP